MPLSHLDKTAFHEHSRSSRTASLREGKMGDANINK
jgi:hypothetical protein